MNATTDVAIVGAGPYGLSVAAHLRSAGTAFREFGLPMNLWRTKMPAGMFLKSQGFASNLSDPAGTHTLEAFCRATGRPYKYYGLPVSLDTFVAYGQWFQAELVPDLEETLVTKLTQAGGQFQLTLSDGTSVQARRVVVAAGVEHFAYVPEPLDTLPASACTHASAHTDLSAFAGQRVMVVGAGQSALESAALLHEGGAGGNGSPGTGSRWPRTGRRSSGCASRRRALARAGAAGSTPTIPRSTVTCPSAPASTVPVPPSARPGLTGCAPGSKGSSRS
jgi:FAD-dependent urate hydroxylase